VIFLRFCFILKKSDNVFLLDLQKKLIKKMKKDIKNHTILSKMTRGRGQMPRVIRQMSRVIL
jgi:hypothetical protein